MAGGARSMLVVGSDSGIGGELWRVTVVLFRVSDFARVCHVMVRGNCG